MTEEKTYSFELTLEQVNQILECLGEQPFSKVYQLITSIQRQAQEQLGTQEPDEG